jgi:hypothetical protein
VRYLSLRPSIAWIPFRHSRYHKVGHVFADNAFSFEWNLSSLVWSGLDDLG